MQLPEGHHLLANSAEAAKELQSRAKEAHISRLPVVTAAGELVSINLRAALLEFAKSEVFELATPEFDSWQFNFLLCFDSAGTTKRGAEIGSSSTPLILVPTTIRPLSSATAAAILVALTNVTDKDHLNLEAAFVNVIEAIAECNGMELLCPHTGKTCTVRIQLALDGAAWLVAANTKGPSADVGKLAHSTASSADIADPQLHLASTTDASFGKVPLSPHTLPAAASQGQPSRNLLQTCPPVPAPFVHPSGHRGNPQGPEHRAAQEAGQRHGRLHGDAPLLNGRLRDPARLAAPAPHASQLDVDSDVRRARRGRLSS